MYDQKFFSGYLAMTPYSPFEDSESFQAEAKYHPERTIIRGTHRNRGRGPNSYPTALATADVLKLAIDELDVTSYQFNKLIGAPFEHYTRRWLRGERRISSVYMARLVQLLLMNSGGLPVRLMRSIDWQSSVIVWRNGAATEGSHYPPPNPPNRKKPKRAIQTLGANRDLRELPEMRISPGTFRFGS
jgi:hypothetical protein